MKALELAKMFGNCDRWTELKDSHYDQAAAELRRLAEMNAELVDALVSISDHLERIGDTRLSKDGQYIIRARAAVSKAKAL